MACYVQIEYSSQEKMQKCPHHISQIMTGFYKLFGHNAIFSCSDIVPANTLEVKYRGKKMIYDMFDGYQNVDIIKKKLTECDYYFKRSFSEILNAEFEIKADNMFPLGFNYYVDWLWNPVHSAPKYILFFQRALSLVGHIPFVRDLDSAKVLMRKYIPTPERYAYKPSYKVNETPNIIFFTRLWNNEEELNRKRIELIRVLRSKYGEHFNGGLIDSLLARKEAPELILPNHDTSLYNYIEIMQNADICIGSMGLHQSIGWKTGEYIASSKAIVNEKFAYSVPGDFVEGKNFFSFSTTEECVDALEHLFSNPQKILEMQFENHKYYTHFLAPEKIVLNSLKVAFGQEFSL